MEAAFLRLESVTLGLGWLGPVAYGAAYVLAALAFVPGSALTLGAGAIFGPFRGLAVVSLASTAAGALAFLIARHLARHRVESLARSYPRFRAIDAAIAEGGWKVVALLRLSPAMPFSAGNYLFGLTGVAFWPYVAACEIGDALNAFVCEHFQESGLLLTFFCLFLNLERRCLRYSGFGHPPALLRKPSGEVLQFDSENSIIGLEREMTRSCSMLSVPFEPGDRLVLYTDGVTETADPAGEFLGVEGLKGLVAETARLPVQEAVAAVCERVDAFGEGAPPADDRLLLALEFAG